MSESLARRRVYWLQRELVLGGGDQGALDDALDAAVLAYREAGAVALRWEVLVEAAGPSAEERLAGWLEESVRRPRRAAVCISGA